MKVIDLLNKMANGEDVPKKIKYYGCIYELKDRNYEYYNYKDNEGNYLEDEWFLTNILNDELEIIEDTPKEDKKINRVERKARNLTNQYIKDKLNEIINRLNGEDNE